MGISKKESSKHARYSIVLTGGHAATTAYATVQEIIKQGKNWEIYFIGSKVAVEGRNFPTLEYDLLPKLNIKFLTIASSRFQRKFTIHTIPSILKFPIAFFQSIFYISKIKPKLVLSFGGFASIPVVVSAKMVGIPIILHEQTSAAGRASIVTSWFANKIAVARESSIKYFSEKKCILIGNPVSTEVSSIKPFNKLGHTATIFVTGGSRGSVNINNAVEGILPEILKTYNLVHQTGDQDIEKFRILRASLAKHLRDKYQVFSRLYPQEMSAVYKKSDIIISRSGANTVSEIIMMKKPSILIPLPISYLDEQMKNAKYAESIGLSKVIKQDNLTSESLFKEIKYIAENYENILKKVNTFDSPDKNAGTRLVGLMADFVK